MSNVLAFEPKRTCVFQADKKRHITDRFSVQKHHKMTIRQFLFFTSCGKEFELN